MPPSATALITGVAGQDGVYLARRLMASGQRVVGTLQPGRRTCSPMIVYLDGVELIEHDVRDTQGWQGLLRDHRPQEIYNLASFSSVGASWEQPRLVEEINGDAVERAIAAVVSHRDATGDEIRFFQASSSEELGSAADSPYARAKAHATAAIAHARETHGLFACAAWLYNHESPLRRKEFVTRKVTRAAAEISIGIRTRLTLGNLEVSRDWGMARDYVEAMELMLRRDQPVDLPIGTGISHTLRELLTTAFDCVGLGDPMSWVEQDANLFRPADSRVMIAHTGPAEQALGWRATTRFETLIREMVEIDLRRIRSGVEESPDYVAEVR